MRKKLGISGLALVLIFVIGCKSKNPSPQIQELKSFPLDSLDQVITRSGLELDQTNSADGKGSIKISADEPTTIALFETGEMDIENAQLIYQAKLKSKNLDGKAYLEMWCHFPGKGEFFSRGLKNPVSGTMNWISSETPFFLKEAENPDNVKLNLVIEGKGTVWIDDIKLLKAPL